MAVVNVTSVLAQLSVTGTTSYALHRAGFKSLPGVPSCCPRYEYGKGLDISLGASYLLDIDSVFGIDVALSSNMLTARFTATEAALLNAQAGQGQAQGNFRHDLSASIVGIVLEPTLRAQFGTLALNLGPSLELPLMSSYTQAETIETPGYVFADNGARTRNHRDGSIDGLSSMFTSFRLAVGTSLVVGRGTMRIEPQVTARYVVGSLLANDVWSTYSVGAGLRISWQRPGVQPPTPVDTATSEVPALPEPTVLPIARLVDIPIVDSIRAVMVDSSGREMASGDLTVLNEIATNMYTMLTYVFFDEGSAVMPSRYKVFSQTEATSFKISQLEGTGTLAIYHNMLNVVGARLREYPKARITITGCKDVRETDDRFPNIARQRVDVVKDYLVNSFGIEPSRIAVAVRGLPEVASNSTTDDGAEENRRVEITSSMWEVLEPISFQDTTRFTTYSDTIRFPVSPKIIVRGSYSGSMADVQWHLDISQGSTKLRSFTGIGEPPASMNWNIAEDPNSIPKTEEEVTYRVTFLRAGVPLLDNTGRLFSVRQVTTRLRSIERYSLIIFGFNESSVSASNQRILSYIQQRVKPSSQVTVGGYTDRSGELAYNKKLSQRRADAVAALLNLPSSQSLGYGSEELLYSNDLPEGRLYCRTVRVTVETPIDQRH